MRINSENKTMDMEARDLNYILPAYVRSYLFYSKNEMPEKIIFPMFASVKVGTTDIPIEYVPPLDAIAVEIAKNGEEVAEVTPEQEAAIDDKEAETEALKAKMAELTEPPAPEDLIRQQEEAAQAAKEEAEEQGIDPDYEAARADQPEPSVSPAKAAFAQPEPPYAIGDTPEVRDEEPAKPDRLPKQPPGGDIGPGLPLSDMHARDRKDQIQTAKDLVEEPEIEGTPEKPFEKEISRDEQGRPVVEEKPDATRED